jgi:Holliday junction DNA helicase RuvA
MIDAVRGRLVGLDAEGLSLDVGGVTLRLLAPGGVLRQLGPLEDSTGGPPVVRLHTHLIVRPDAWLLFGFLDPQERQLFRVLLGIPGIGPRLALSLLSHLTREDIQAAVAARDARRFESVPGVGKRTAARVLLELTGKLAQTPPAAPPRGAGPVADAADALVALGLSRAEADALVRAAAHETGAEAEADQLVAAALRRRGRGE